MSAFEQPKLPKKIEEKLRARQGTNMQAKADELGIDPFAVLLLYAGGKAKELGYTSKEKIGHGLRIEAARECCKYMYPQLKSVEVSGPGGGEIEVRVGLAQTLLQILEAQARQRVE